MNPYDSILKDFREILERNHDNLLRDDRNALWRCMREFDCVTNCFEREERRNAECNKVLSRMKERMTPHTASWVRNGIHHAMDELRKY